MTGDYEIVRVHNNPVQEGGGLAALEAAVKVRVADGWLPIGAPFYDSYLMLWCQSMHRPGMPSAAGEVQLREPGTIQQAEMPRTHRDSKDGPLIMREPKK